VPVRGLALSVACAVTAVWGGIGLSYAVTALPVSFSIMSIAAMTYLAFGLGRQIGVARKVKRPLSRAP
jgi:hypothetical protein